MLVVEAEQEVEQLVQEVVEQQEVLLQMEHQEQLIQVEEVEEHVQEVQLKQQVQAVQESLLQDYQTQVMFYLQVQVQTLLQVHHAVHKLQHLQFQEI